MHSRLPRQLWWLGVRADTDRAVPITFTPQRGARPTARQP